MNIHWNADNYTANFSFVHQYGAGVLELLDAENCRSVLDLGCGNGALSSSLMEKGFQVTGIDASSEMLEIARRNHPGIEFVQADATCFSLPEPVDAVFSNAVFHWIDAEKQPDMLNCVYRALKPGGQFVFEFGGHGNNQLVHAELARIFAERGHAYRMPFYFPTVGEYAALLEAAGFLVRFALHFDRPTLLKGENGLKDWINMFITAPFSVIDDPAEKDAIQDEAVERLRGTLFKDGKWYADYVRLRMKAVKP